LGDPGEGKLANLTPLAAEKTATPMSAARSPLPSCWLLLAFGCAGYHIGPVTKRNFNTIAVPMFRNEHCVRNSKRKSVTRCQAAATGWLVAHRTEPRADVVLSGTVFRYERTALRTLHSDTGVPREYEIAITVRVEARDRRTGEVVLKSTAVQGKSDVFIGEDQQSSEMQALPL